MEKRKVGSDGSIKYKGKRYLSHTLKDHVGETFGIKPILEVKVLWIIDEDNNVVCEAREEGVSFEETIGVSKGKENTGSEGMFGRKKLKDYKTEEIVKELVKRYGVSVMKVRAGCQYQVKGNGSRVKEEGPATVLVVRG